MNEAKAEGKRRRAAVVQFQSATGRVYRWYWDGAAYRDRPNPMYARVTAYKFGGTYIA